MPLRIAGTARSSAYDFWSVVVERCATTTHEIVWRVLRLIGLVLKWFARVAVTIYFPQELNQLLCRDLEQECKSIDSARSIEMPVVLHAPRIIQSSREGLPSSSNCRHRGAHVESDLCPPYTKRLPGDRVADSRYGSAYVVTA